ncbi:MAG TPA: hypothetical protein VFU47_04185, partial [Armatimonadota bacterium]|nr:hypothetical protein [Armatimonadota bacterium]
ALSVSHTGDIRYLPLDFAHLAPAAGLPPGFTPPEPLYAAPELMLGTTAGEASLLFSVAAWSYAMLAGATERSPALLVLSGSAPDPLWDLRPTLPAGVDTALQRALRREPSGRYASLHEFAAAIRQATQTAPAAPPAPASEPTLAWRPPESQPVSLWGLLAAAAGLAAAGLAFGWVVAQLTGR